ncbi:hypothetical protein QJS66_11115 [Kocuria rhizophila]|nr:hypothetical protein QJS66_11115 [Kocuria rhizophila]
MTFTQHVSRSPADPGAPPLREPRDVRGGLPVTATSSTSTSTRAPVREGLGHPGVRPAAAGTPQVRGLNRERSRRSRGRVRIVAGGGSEVVRRAPADGSPARTAGTPVRPLRHTCPLRGDTSARSASGVAPTQTGPGR